MRLDVFAYRAGTILALLAIYAAVDGPTIGQGGGSMTVAMGLMFVGLFHHAISEKIADIRRPDDMQEASA